MDNMLSKTPHPVVLYASGEAHGAPGAPPRDIAPGTSSEGEGAERPFLRFAAVEDLSVLYTSPSPTPPPPFPIPVSLH